MALDFRKWGEEEMKRRPRRPWLRWSLVGGLAFVVLIPVTHMLSPGDARMFPQVIPLSILLMVSAMQSPFTRDTIFTRRGFAKFDEFERAALHEAIRRAYLLSVVVIGAVFAWLMIAARVGLPVPTTMPQWGAVGYAIVITMLVMPAIVAEFTVPMPDIDDEPM